MLRRGIFLSMDHGPTPSVQWFVGIRRLGKVSPLFPRRDQNSASANSIVAHYTLALLLLALRPPRDAWVVQTRLHPLSVIAFGTDRLMTLICLTNVFLQTATRFFSADNSRIGLVVRLH